MSSTTETVATVHLTFQLKYDSTKKLSLFQVIAMGDIQPVLDTVHDKMFTAIGDNEPVTHITFQSPTGIWKVDGLIHSALTPEHIGDDMMVCTPLHPNSTVTEPNDPHDDASSTTSTTPLPRHVYPA